MITTAKQLQVVELRAQNFSIIEIAKEAHLNRNTVADIIKNQSELVTALHAIELDKLYKEAKISKTHRLKSLSLMLNKIQAEIEKRDLSDVPTEKLIELFFKNHALLEAEAVEPNIMSTEEVTAFKKERALLTDLEPVKEAVNLREVVRQLSGINSGIGEEVKEIVTGS